MFVHFLRDYNTPSHTSEFVKRFFNSEKVTVLQHSPYYLDPCTRSFFKILHYSYQFVVTRSNNPLASQNSDLQRSTQISTRVFKEFPLISQSCLESHLSAFLLINLRECNVKGILLKINKAVCFIYRDAVANTNLVIILIVTL